LGRGGLKVSGHPLEKRIYWDVSGQAYIDAEAEIEAKPNDDNRCVSSPKFGGSKGLDQEEKD
jgi:hypothetical protein